MRINMKTCLLSLLLLFLLVHTSEAVPVGSLLRLLKPLFKALVRKSGKEGAEAVWQIGWDEFKNHLHGPPPPAQEAPPDNFNAPSPPAPPYDSIYGPSPPAPPYDSFYGPAPAPLPDAEQIRSAKQYLSNYGYIPYAGDPHNDDDSLDEGTVSAIKKFQKFFNLPLTGNLDDKTLKRMSWRRCGVPDKHLTYDLSAANDASWPLGTKWFPNNGSANNNLTYGFAPDNNLPDVIIRVFHDSFQRWSDAIGVLKLTEAPYEVADIRTGFFLSDPEKGLGLEVVGGTVIQLQDGDDHHHHSHQEASNDNYNVTFGSMILVGEKRWALPTYKVDDLSWEDDIVDLETVVMHQIGHLLGLSHSPHADSVMYPYILPSQQRKVELSNDDKGQIQQVYFSDGSSGVFTLVDTSCGLLTSTLSLGFAACMVLFY